MARWLCDENVPRLLVDALRQKGHDVSWVREDSPGMPDEDVLALAIRDRRICLTFDKDFGLLAARTSIPLVSGVMLLRLSPPRSPDVARSIVSIIDSRNDWDGHFSVLEFGRIRMRRLT